MCHNLKKPNYSYYRAEEDDLDITEFSSLLPDTERLQVHLHLQGLSDGCYTVKTRLVNRQVGSVQDRWINMGMESSLTPEGLEYLRVGSFGDMKACVMESQDGCLNVRWDLEPNEIRYVHIYRKDRI